MATVPALAYDFAALEPIIDAQTMMIHHDKHHQAYVDKLNEQYAQNPGLEEKPLEELMASISKYSPAVRNNGGGHFNHSLFWSLMAPQGKGGAPSPELLKAIDADLGGLEKMKEAVNAAAIARFGSGWGWVIVNESGKLAITSTPNQDNPLMDVVEMKGKPIVGVDVWEHAYYLKYQNKRADYLKNWWSVVNWQVVNELYTAATSKK